VAEFGLNKGKEVYKGRRPRLSNETLLVTPDPSHVLELITLLAKDDSLDDLGFQSLNEAQTRLVQLVEDPHSFVFGIQHADQLIGFSILKDLGPNRRTLEVGVYIEPSSRSIKIYSEVYLHLFDEMFATPHYNRAQISLLITNKKSIRFLKWFGLRQECRMIEGLWLHGKPVDIVVLRLLRKKWFRLKKGWVNARRNRKQSSSRSSVRESPRDAGLTEPRSGTLVAAGGSTGE
jgi:RimJ/RimL family protein N-acetyltransferase